MYLDWTFWTDYSFTLPFLISLLQIHTMKRSTSLYQLISQQREPTHPTGSFVRKLLFSLFLMQMLSNACAQQPASAVSLTYVPDNGFLLNKEWRFQPGDIPNGASIQLDDRQWSTIDPAKDIRELPQLQRAGIGWLRLHIHTGSDLPPLMIKVFQSVASEMYLDGRLLYRFGTISTNLDSVRAYNPVAAFSLPLLPSSNHVLAIRFASQPGRLYTLKNLAWDTAALQLWVFPTTAVPAIKPVDIQAIYLDTFRFGIAFILFILHLSLFFVHRTQRANLYASGMYLLLGVTLLARVASGFVHSLPLRMLVYYCVWVDVLIPGLVILTFYSLFRFRRGWLFWLAIGSVFLKLIPLPIGVQWFSIPLNYFLPLELIRLSLVAIRRGLPGARIITVCAFSNVGLWTLSYALFALHVPNYGHEWLFHAFYLASFLCFPLTLSLLLASEHGWINQQLIVQLQEVKILSARNLAQQQERQELLARQNEQLEVQVAERTYELHQQAHQLRELDEVKSRFVANVTHEFRTPLSLIIGPVEKLLQESRFDRSTLAMVERNARHLLRLINQLLDLSRLENNHMASSLTQGDVPEFVAQIVDLFRPLAGQKAITLVYQTEPFPPQPFGFDADKWEKILTNILANALKFTHAGGVVTLRLVPIWTVDELTGVRVEVTDTGIGISAEALPHVFDRFYQADSSHTRAYLGTGIGLALTKELTDLLGGTITVASTPDAGTIFCLMLPVQSVSDRVDIPQLSWQLHDPKTELPMSMPVSGTATDPSDNGRTGFRRTGFRHTASRLLIVEDNDELREFLVNELSPTYSVIQAADGVEGWAMVQTELPDLVLTDVMMPRMDGHQLTHCIKTHAETDHIAVVMLTAKSNQQSRIEGLRQGADEYLAKPFSVAELHLRLHNLISRQQKLVAYYRQQFVLPTVVYTEPEATKVAVTDPFLTRIYGLLDQHLDDDSIGVDWLADQMSMNRKTLYRKVQSLIQLPPADLIRQYRLRKAAELLRAGRNVSETADLTGFSTASHLASVFKDFYQQTPTEFMANRP